MVDFADLRPKCARSPTPDAPDGTPRQKVAQQYCQEPPQPASVSSENISMLEAVDAGDIAAVEQWLAAGADLSTPDEEMGWTALHRAVNIANKEMRLRMIEALLNMGASVDLDDAYSMTPLHLAAEDGCVETMRMMMYRTQRERRGSVEYIAHRQENYEVYQVLTDRWENPDPVLEAEGRAVATTAPPSMFVTVQATPIESQQWQQPQQQQQQRGTPRPPPLPHPSQLQPVAPIRKKPKGGFACCGSKER